MVLCPANPTPGLAALHHPARNCSCLALGAPGACPPSGETGQGWLNTCEPFSASVPSKLLRNEPEIRVKRGFKMELKKKCCGHVAWVPWSGVCRAIPKPCRFTSELYGSGSGSGCRTCWQLLEHTARKRESKRETCCRYLYTRTSHEHVLYFSRGKYHPRDIIIS